MKKKKKKLKCITATHLFCTLREVGIPIRNGQKQMLEFREGITCHTDFGFLRLSLGWTESKMPKLAIFEKRKPLNKKKENSTFLSDPSEPGE